MKWLLIPACVLMVGAWFVSDKVDQMDRVQRAQAALIARQQVVIDSLCTVIYLRGWYQQRWRSQAEANLIALNGMALGYADTRAWLDSLNTWWEGIR
jgi:hypothetical protein